MQSFPVPRRPGNQTPGGEPSRELFVREVDAKPPGTDTGVECRMFAWSPDGAEIAVTDFDYSQPQKPPTAVHTIVTVATRKATRLKLPPYHAITDWSRDGKFFLTTRYSDDRANRVSRLYLMNRDGTEHKALTGEMEWAMFGKLSPDGKQVLTFTSEPVVETPVGKKLRDDLGLAPKRPMLVLSVIDTVAGSMTKLGGHPPSATIQGYSWSPDGKKIAYAWQEVHDGGREKPVESRLVVCDADGNNAKTIASETGKSGEVTIGHVDWR